jgi:hypothetical protein
LGAEPRRRAFDGLHGSAADGRNLTTHMTRAHLETFDMTQSPNCPQPRLCCVLAVVTVAFVLLCPSIAGAAGSSVTVGPPIEVPWLIDINPFSLATVATLANGSFAVAGLNEYFDANNLIVTAVVAQFFRPDGAPRTRPTILIQPPAEVFDTGIGSVGDRYFLAVKYQKRTYALFYSGAGTPLGPPFRWPSSDIDEFMTYYRFGGAPLWRFLPITHHLIGYDQDNIPLYNSFFQVADADGVRLGVPVELPNVGDAAINGTGRFVVVEEQPPCPPCAVRGIRIFDSAVRPLTPLLTDGVPQYEEPGGILNSPAAPAINNRGEVLLLWMAGIQDVSGGHVVARLFSGAGVPALQVIQVAMPTPLQYAALAARPIALNDGSFLVSWFISYNTPSRTIKVFMTRLDPKSGSVDEPLVLAEGDLKDWVLNVNSSGRGVIAWQIGEGFPSAAYLRIIKVTP